jgi:hypothetical protein
MPRFRNGPLEWAVASILLLGLIALWLLPSYAWVPLPIMGYAVGYYAGRRSSPNLRDR